jgi:hypothetical protein
MPEKSAGTVIERDEPIAEERTATPEPKILRVRRIDLEVNDPDINMCSCHCISYCTCNCDRGGIIS